MTKFFFETEQNHNGKITGLSTRRNDGKIYKVKCRNNGKWEVLEYRGRDGVFNAVLNDSYLTLHNHKLLLLCMHILPKLYNSSIFF